MYEKAWRKAQEVLDQETELVSRTVLEDFMDSVDKEMFRLLSTIERLKKNRIPFWLMYKGRRAREIIERQEREIDELTKQSHNSPKS